MSKYIIGNMGLVKESVIEGIVIKRNNEVYAICKEKEILINKCENSVEAELFLNKCMINIEKENTISLQNPISLIEKKY
ncbi:hypothetical protein [Megamonas funiformis]|uniref:hypothetical protein n=1 Tax=Megamonas funiformis TaxID=437897 RepID=UPI004027C841